MFTSTTISTQILSIAAKQSMSESFNREENCNKLTGGNTFSNIKMING